METQFGHLPKIEHSDFDIILFSSLFSPSSLPVIDISAELSEINPKKGIIDFNPTNSLLYDGYVIKALDDSLDPECVDYVSEFGQKLYEGKGCGRYWTNKPASCQPQFLVAATRNERRVSDTEELNTLLGKTYSL